MQQNDLCLYKVHYTSKAAAAMLAELYFSSQSTLCTSIFFKKYTMLINGSNGFGWHSFTGQRPHSSDLCPILLHKEKWIVKKISFSIFIQTGYGEHMLLDSDHVKWILKSGALQFILLASLTAISSPWASPLDLLSKYLFPGSTNFHPGKLKAFSWGPKLFRVALFAKSYSDSPQTTICNIVFIAFLGGTTNCTVPLFKQLPEDQGRALPDSKKVSNNPMETSLCCWHQKQPGTQRLTRSCNHLPPEGMRDCNKAIPGQDDWFGKQTRLTEMIRAKKMDSWKVASKCGCCEEAP